MRLRFRVRTLLVLVAAVALLLSGGMMGWRSFGHYRRAQYFATQEYGWRQIVSRDRQDAAFAAECAEYFSRLTRKYRRATLRPWITLGPDPHAPGYDLWLEQERRAACSASAP